MLVLSRRPGQGLRIGPSIELQVVRIEGDRVVLGIAAPREIAVVRSELMAEVGDEVREAAGTVAAIRALVRPRE
jgi:carbon storage regulator